jgi:hypothetical protein
MFSGTAQVSRQVCQFFFFSSVCVLVHVTMVDKNKAVVCCLLATSARILPEGFWKVECLEMMPSCCLQVN